MYLFHIIHAISLLFHLFSHMIISILKWIIGILWRFDQMFLCFSIALYAPLLRNLMVPSYQIKFWMKIITFPPCSKWILYQKGPELSILEESFSKAKNGCKWILFTMKIRFAISYFQYDHYFTSSLIFLKLFLK